MTGRRLIRFDRMGKAPSPAERLERLRHEVEIARKAYLSRPCHALEIRQARMELQLDEFLERHPELAKA